MGSVFTEVAKNLFGPQVCAAIASSHTEIKKKAAHDIEIIARNYQERDAGAAAKATEHLMNVLEEEFGGIKRSSAGITVISRLRDHVVGCMIALVGVVRGARTSDTVVRRALEDMHSIIVHTSDVYTLYITAECVFNMMIIAPQLLAHESDCLLDILHQLWQIKETKLGNAKLHLNNGLKKIQFVSKFAFVQSLLSRCAKSQQFGGANIMYVIGWLDTIDFHEQFDVEQSILNETVMDFWETLCALNDQCNPTQRSIVENAVLSLSEVFLSSVAASGSHQIKLSDDFLYRRLPRCLLRLKNPKIIEIFLCNLYKDKSSPFTDYAEFTVLCMNYFIRHSLILWDLNVDLLNDESVVGKPAQKALGFILTDANATTDNIAHACQWVNMKNLTTELLPKIMKAVMLHKNPLVGVLAAELFTGCTIADSIWREVDFKDVPFDAYTFRNVAHMLSKMTDNPKVLLGRIGQISKEFGQVGGIIETLLVWVCVCEPISSLREEIRRGNCDNTSCDGESNLCANLNWISTAFVNLAMGRKCFSLKLTAAPLELCYQAELCMMLLELPESAYLRLNAQHLTHYLTLILPITSPYCNTALKRGILPNNCDCSIVIDRLHEETVWDQALTLADNCLRNLEEAIAQSISEKRVPLQQSREVNAETELQCCDTPLTAESSDASIIANNVGGNRNCLDESPSTR